MYRYLSMFAECNGVNGKLIILVDKFAYALEHGELVSLECFFTNLESQECLKTLVAKRIRRVCAF